MAARLNGTQGGWRKVSLLIGAATALGWSLLPGQAAWARQSLTVRDAIQTTRAMIDRDGNAVFVSPDGRRFAILLINGDVERNGVWADLRVGRLESIAHARPVSVARLFTQARGGGYLRHGGSELLLWPKRNVPRWIDNRHLALLWEDAQGLRQLVSVNVDTKQVRYLTHHRSDVLHFGAFADGTVVYGASVPCTPSPSAQQRVEGFVVQAADAFEMAYGCGAWQRDRQALFVISPVHGEAHQVLMHGGDAVSHSAPLFPAALFSPSGDQAIFPNTVSDIPKQWQAYTAEHFRTMWRSREVDVGGGGPYASQFRKLFVIDIATATARALWSVPMEPYARLRAAWAPDGRTVVVGPTFLPVATADPAGLAGEAVAAVDVRSGQYQQLPVPAATARRIHQIRWWSPSEVQIVLDEGCLRYRRTGVRWAAVPDRTGLHCRESSRIAPAALHIEFEQSLNIAPRFVAVESASGQRQTILDPNDDLAQRFALGQVQWLERSAGGYRWEGRLYYPVDYQPGRRYPLVIQTHSMAGRQEFSLSSRGGGSPTLGPSYSVYLAQPLANRGFFVLHGRALGVDPHAGVLRETQIQIATTEVVVDSLAAERLIDRSRVGLMGFSASGWQVAYAISHSRFPYAAALTDDNKDGSYSQAAHANWVFGVGEEMIGAAPFGEGLNAWLAESPAFNAHRISTPLMLAASSPGTELSNWELFSRLRYLGKPVEYYVVPDLAHGSHGLQNPAQLLALQERALDWWCFWLKGEEDAVPGKTAQYTGWRALRERQRLKASGVAAIE